VAVIADKSMLRHRSNPNNIISSLIAPPFFILCALTLMCNVHNVRARVMRPPVSPNRRRVGRRLSSVMAKGPLARQETQ